MRRFHSYGPVDLADHFGVERRELIERCAAELVGEADKGGHFFRSVPGMFRDGFAFKPPAPSDWDWRDLFAWQGGVFDRPLHVPNLTRDEVLEMFAQYQAESGQAIDPAVVDRVYEVTRGQPGLVGWFGELLTEKYNPGPSETIEPKHWDRVYMLACQVEPNNTVLNLIKKARGPHRDRVMELFGRADVRFSFDDEACNYLYLNGVIDYQETLGAGGMPMTVCRFSSPFIQLRLYNAFTVDLFTDRLPVLPLEPLDALEDVFSSAEVDMPALLRRYRVTTVAIGWG